MPSTVSVFTDKQLLIGLAVVAIPVIYLSYKAKGVVDAVIDSDANLLNPDNKYVVDLAEWIAGTHDGVMLTDSQIERLNEGDF